MVDWFLLRVERCIMSLNIKSEQTHQLVRELAELTGQTQTDAVNSAVQEKLAALHQRERGGTAERMLALGQEMSGLLQEPYKSTEHGELLYDEKGLPA